MNTTNGAWQLVFGFVATNILLCGEVMDGVRDGVMDGARDDVRDEGWFEGWMA